MTNVQMATAEVHATITMSAFAHHDGTEVERVSFGLM
jgi:hypothetical protein